MMSYRRFIDVKVCISHSTGRVKSPTKISKKRGLDRISIFKGGLLVRGSDFFRGAGVGVAIFK